MRGFLLQNGDLVIGSQGYAEVTGQQKIQQDLNVATLEPYGCDYFHPRWGSLLGNYIGNPSTNQTQTLVSSEITRIVQNYMLVQTNVQNRAKLAGKQSPFNNDDIVMGFSSLKVTQTADSMTVNAQVVTAANTSVSITTTTTS